MLRFITAIYTVAKVAIGFQYISCYGLSINCKTIIIVIYNFNTSHVTVYQKVQLLVQIPTFVFQYISCYGLSARTNSTTYQSTDFNTSHVTVYRTHREVFQLHQNYFNTSHVTVYLSIITIFLS